MRILITAGPTWSKIDDVRILTNIFTGRTGAYLAEEFKKKGNSVTLFLNPHTIRDRIKGVKIIPFKYYEDFKEKIVKELRKTRFDLIIHSAAVGDYKLKRMLYGKISSEKKQLTLRLVPTEKIIKKIRELAKEAILIQFKLEAKRKGLNKKAYASLKSNRSDFVVANALEDLRLGYKAWIIDKSKKVTALNSKKSLFTALYKILYKKRREL